MSIDRLIGELTYTMVGRWTEILADLQRHIDNVTDEPKVLAYFSFSP